MADTKAKPKAPAKSGGGESILTDEYAGIPGWGWGAIIAGAGVVTFVTVRYIRGKRGAASTTAGSDQAAGADQGAGAFGGGGGGPGSGNNQPPGSGTTLVDPGAGEDTTFRSQPIDNGSTTAAPGPKANPNPPSSSLFEKIPAAIGSVLVGGGTTHNPVGYADSQQAANPTSYMPSVLDRLTERPMGVQYQLEGPGANPSAYSTIYTNVAPSDFGATPAGQTPQLGKTVTGSQRIAGERYIALPGGKYQVVN